MPVTRSVSARSLLERPVVLNGIKLGQPYDLVLDEESMRALGLEVVCEDEVHRFLPLPAARIRDDEIAVGSALLLLEERDMDFYRSRSRTFRALEEAGVEDLLLDENGDVTVVRKASVA